MSQIETKLFQQAPPNDMVQGGEPLQDPETPYWNDFTTQRIINVIAKGGEWIVGYSRSMSQVRGIDSLKIGPDEFVRFQDENQDAAGKGSPLLFNLLNRPDRLVFGVDP